MTDYKTLIDAETWAFIERTNSYYPPDTIDYTITQQRAIYDRSVRGTATGDPAALKRRMACFLHDHKDSRLRQEKTTHR